MSKFAQKSTKNSSNLKIVENNGNRSDPPSDPKSSQSSRGHRRPAVAAPPPCSFPAEAPPSRGFLFAADWWRSSLMCKMCPPQPPIYGAARHWNNSRTALIDSRLRWISSIVPRTLSSRRGSTPRQSLHCFPLLSPLTRDVALVVVSQCGLPRGLPI